MKPIFVIFIGLFLITSGIAATAQGHIEASPPTTSIDTNSISSKKAVDSKEIERSIPDKNKPFQPQVDLQVKQWAHEQNKLNQQEQTQTPSRPKDILLDQEKQKTQKKKESKKMKAIKAENLEEKVENEKSTINKSFAKQEKPSEKTKATAQPTKTEESLNLIVKQKDHEAKKIQEQKLDIKKTEEGELIQPNNLKIQEQQRQSLKSDRIKEPQSQMEEIKIIPAQKKKSKAQTQTSNNQKQIVKQHKQLSDQLTKIQDSVSVGNKEKQIKAIKPPEPNLKDDEESMNEQQIHAQSDAKQKVIQITKVEQERNNNDKNTQTMIIQTQQKEKEKKLKIIPIQQQKPENSESNINVKDKTQATQKDKVQTKESKVNIDIKNELKAIENNQIKDQNDLLEVQTNKEGDIQSKPVEENDRKIQNKNQIQDMIDELRSSNEKLSETSKIMLIKYLEEDRQLHRSVLHSQQQINEEKRKSVQVIEGKQAPTPIIEQQQQSAMVQVRSHKQLKEEDSDKDFISNKQMDTSTIIVIIVLTFLISIPIFKEMRASNNLETKTQGQVVSENRYDNSVSNQFINPEPQAPEPQQHTYHYQEQYN